MKFDTQIVNVINELCNKFGIVIDWTSRDTVSQLQELAIRYTKYKIFTFAMGSGISLICVIICVVVSVKLFQSYVTCKKEKHSNVFFNYNEFIQSVVEIKDSTGVIIVITAIVFVVTFVVGIFDIYDLLNWIFIPEIQIFKSISQWVSVT